MTNLQPNFPRLRAIIFDFDGVILESADIKTEAFADLAADYPEHQDAFIAYHEAHLGISRYEKFRWLYEERLGRPFTDAIRAQMGQRFSVLVVARILACPFVPGALALLGALQGQMPAFVASGTPQAELENIIARRDLTGYFNEIWGTPAEKPHIINDIRARFGYNAAEVLMVGDGLSDYRAALATGVPFVGRATPGNQAEWRRLGVRQVTDLSDLAKELDEKLLVAR